MGQARAEFFRSQCRRTYLPAPRRLQCGWIPGFQRRIRFTFDKPAPCTRRDSGIVCQTRRSAHYQSLCENRQHPLPCRSRFSKPLDSTDVRRTATGEGADLDLFLIVHISLREFLEEAVEQVGDAEVRSPLVEIVEVKFGSTNHQNASKIVPLTFRCFSSGTILAEFVQDRIFRR